MVADKFGVTDISNSIGCIFNGETSSGSYDKTTLDLNNKNHSQNSEVFSKFLNGVTIEKNDGSINRTSLRSLTHQIGASLMAKLAQVLTTNLLFDLNNKNYFQKYEIF